MSRVVYILVLLRQSQLTHAVPWTYSCYLFHFFLFKVLFYFLIGLFSLETNYFTILSWFLPYIDMNQPWVYMCPHPELPSRLPPHPIPQGCPSALALSALFHASNLDWPSVSPVVIYMFQCYSLKASHLHLLWQSPKVCSLHLCLFCCLTYRVIIPSF